MAVLELNDPQVRVFFVSKFQHRSRPTRSEICALTKGRLS